VLALRLAAAGARVRYVTSEGRAGAWSEYTAEQTRTQRALIEAGIAIEVNSALASFDGCAAGLACVYTGREHEVAATAVLLVTAREPDEALFRALTGGAADDPEAGAATPGRVLRIGDCRQPALIANAVYSGHRAGRELGRSGEAAAPRRDRVRI
jgi:dimethylamine/trimethylamine dehydrogenase